MNERPKRLYKSNNCDELKIENKLIKIRKKNVILTISQKVKIIYIYNM